MYGPREIDLDRRVGLQHEGVLRVRRGLLVAAGVVAAIAAVVAVAGDGDAAVGMLGVMLAPLVLILVGAGGVDDHPSSRAPQAHRRRIDRVSPPQSRRSDAAARR